LIVEKKTNIQGNADENFITGSPALAFIRLVLMKAAYRGN
jgi:hypothetical protein